MERSIAARDLVRCLDCGAEYRLEVGEEGAEPCPECGGIGWIAVAAGRRSANRDDDS